MTAVRTASIALVVLLALLVGRDHPLQNLNEGVYARVAQEMLERGSFVVPTLDGVPYLEKPPLVYWITSAAFAVAGPTESAARFASLVGAALALAAAAWFARRHLAPRSDIVGTAILATSPIVAVLARSVMFDLLFTGLLFCALATLYEALRSPAERRWARLSFAFLALAILAKGLAAVVFYVGVAALALALMRRDARRRAARALAEPVAIGLLVAIAAPWHVLAAASQPGFAWFYLVNEHVMRFFDARVPHDYHTGPWWYFLPRIPAYVFPWALSLLLRTEGRTDERERDARRFMWLAFLVPLVVYSMSGGKGEYYMVVGVPPLALLAADRICRARSPTWAVAASALGWLAVVAVLAALPASAIAPYAIPAQARAWIAISAALAAVALVLALRGSAVPAVLACAAAAVPCIALYSDFMRANETLKSSRTLVAEVRSFHDPVYLYREFESVSALPFYLDAPVGVVDSVSGDLWYGLRLAPRPGRFPDAASLERRARNDALWLVVPRAQREPFAASPLTQTFVAEQTIGRYTLYASPPLAERVARARLAAATPDEAGAR